MPTDREPFEKSVEREAADETQRSAPPRSPPPESDDVERSAAVVVQYGEDPGTVDSDER